MNSQPCDIRSPARMDPSRVAPQLRFLSWGNPLWLIEHAWGRRLLRGLTRLLPPLPIRGVTVEIIEGTPPLRIHRPKTRRTDAALLFIHGGGFVVGSPRTTDFRCGDVCRTLGMTVVAVGQRLAPEHPYPLPADDCHAAEASSQRQAASLGIDPNRIAIGGASSGGGLAAGLVQRIHDDGGIQPAAQWLLAPMLDDRTAARRELDGIGHPVWTNRLNRMAWRAYLGREPGAEDVPAYAAPARRDDLSGLPPAYISVGDIDLFYEESRRYAERLQQHGVAVTFEVIPGAPHGFDEIARWSAMARAFMQRSRAWLGRTVGAAER
jgi:acetyl esterase/lipase